MTPKEAAAELGISLKNLMEQVRLGRIRFSDIGTKGRTVHRFTPKNLQTFIENQKKRKGSYSVSCWF
jgi:predicted site-specific integrase-resolvase